MNKNEAREFANYLVYEMTGKNKDKFHPLFICKEWKVAVAMAKILATADPAGDAYKITNIDDGISFTFGGGWEVTYQRNKETGKIERYELS